LEDTVKDIHRRYVWLMALLPERVNTHSESFVYIVIALNFDVDFSHCPQHLRARLV